METATRAHRPPAPERHGVWWTLPRNPAGRDLIVGDLHGHLSRLDAELDRIGFDPRADRLICCGDLVDRGPESSAAADWLARPGHYAVMGNHDAALLAALDRLPPAFELTFGEQDWFAALNGEQQQRLLDALESLPWAIELETAQGRLGVVHAEVPLRCRRWSAFLAELESSDTRLLAVSGRSQARRARDWDDPFAGDGEPVAEVDWVIHGHTPRPGCRPGRLGNRLWIETLGWHDGQLRDGQPRFTLVEAADPTRAL